MGLDNVLLNTGKIINKLVKSIIYTIVGLGLLVFKLSGGNNIYYNLLK